MLWVGLVPPNLIVFQARTLEEAERAAAADPRPVRVVPNPYAVARALKAGDQFALALWRAAADDRAGKLRSVGIKQEGR